MPRSKIILRGVKGATFLEPLTLTNRDGTPLDLTGASLIWRAKANIEDADGAAILTALTSDSTIVVDAPATLGTISFAILAATMDGVTPRIEPEFYVWTLEVKSGANVIRYPDHFQGGPGRLFVEDSAVVALP